MNEFPYPLWNKLCKQSPWRKAWLDKFEITLYHLRKISCKEEEIIKEFNNLWPTINRVWPQYRGLEDISVKILPHFISNHAITHPNVIELIKILLSVAPSTSPMKRSYRKLSKICYKDRNASKVPTMEVLYILSEINHLDIDFDATLAHPEKYKFWFVEFLCWTV